MLQNHYIWIYVYRVYIWVYFKFLLFIAMDGQFEKSHLVCIAIPHKTWLYIQVGWLEKIFYLYVNPHLSITYLQAMKEGASQYLVTMQ